MLESARRRNLDWFLLLTTILALFLSLKSLDNSYLWQDEAETAVIARNTIDYGYPRAYDGKNLVYQIENSFKEGYVWIFHPWLQFYLTAASFMLFGENTIAARLPFALFGVASIVFTYFLALKVSCNMRVARISSVMLALSVPFLLHIRQCRYYSTTVFFTVWVVYAYLMIREGNKKGVLHFVASSVLLFHSNYASFAGVVGGLIVYEFFSNGIVGIKRLIAPILVVMVFVVPWIVYLELWLRSSPLSLLRFFRGIVYYSISLNNYVFPVLFLPTAFWALRRVDRKTFDSSGVLLSVIVVTVLFFSLSPVRYLRFVLNVMPFSFILLSIMFDRIMRWSNFAGVFLVVVLLASNILSAIPAVVAYSQFNVFEDAVGGWLDARGIERSRIERHISFIGEDLENSVKLRIPLADYLRELSHKHNGPPSECMIDYLREDGDSSRTVLTNYDDLSIMFYTNKTVRGVLAYRYLNEPEKPETIIPREGGGFDFVQNLTEGYAEFKLDCPPGEVDSFYHNYRTFLNTEEITIYQKP